MTQNDDLQVYMDALTRAQTRLNEAEQAARVAAFRGVPASQFEAAQREVMDAQATLESVREMGRIRFANA